MPYSFYLSRGLEKVVPHWNLYHKQAFQLHVAGDTGSPSERANVHGFRVTGRPNGITDRKIIFEIIMHLIADTDTDENYFGINISVADADTAVLRSFEGAA